MATIRIFVTMSLAVYIGRRGSGHTLGYLWNLDLPWHASSIVVFSDVALLSCTNLHFPQSNTRGLGLFRTAFVGQIRP